VIVDLDTGEGEVGAQLMAHQLFDLSVGPAHLFEPFGEARVVWVVVAQKRAGDVLTKHAAVLVAAEGVDQAIMLAEVAVLLVRAYADDAIDNSIRRRRDFAPFKKQVDGVVRQALSRRHVVESRKLVDKPAQYFRELAVRRGHLAFPYFRACQSCSATILHGVSRQALLQGCSPL